MIRIAEARRQEEIEDLERINKYNLALIAFSGSFLSLLVSLPFPELVQQIAGGCLIISTLCSLFAILPRKVGGFVVIEDDILALREGKNIFTEEFLLETATIFELVANNIQAFSYKKKQWTIASACVLAFSLIVTYTLIAYA